MNKATIVIQGMSCGHCVHAVSNALKRLDGVDVKDVQVGSATVEYDPAVTSLETVNAAIEDAGYSPQR